MHIKRFDIQNFRKLKCCKIELSDKTTVFVGANNSGCLLYTSDIVNSEWSQRENKKFNRLLRQATLKYPAADLDSSIYEPERQLNTHVINLLAKGNWIDEPNNLLMTGGAGAGKTYIACALCITALHRMRTCLLYTSRCV